MLKRCSRLALLVLCVTLMIGAAALARFDKSDLVAMREKVSAKKREKSAPIFSTTTQDRKGVIKDIFFAQEEGPKLHHRITSDTSTLYLIPEGNHFDLVEKLQGVNCWMQDKLYPETNSSGAEQQVRFLKAQEGFYRYSSQQFIAQSVALSLYRLQGYELPYQGLESLDPFLSGLAQDVSFSFSGKTPQFKAEQFKAVLPQTTKESSL